MVTGLSDLLDELARWTSGQAGDAFVFPLVVDSAEELAAYRGALEEGLDPLRKRLPELEPTHVEDGEIEDDELIALSLALLLQGYQFVRDHRGSPRSIPRDEFRLGRRAYRFIKAASTAVDDLEGDTYATAARALTECRRSLKPVIAERLRAAKERDEARRMGDAVGSVDTAAIVDDLPNRIPRNRGLDEALEVTVDTDLLAEVGTDTQDIPVGPKTPPRKTPAARPRPTTSEPSTPVPEGVTPSGTSRTTLGLIVLVVLVVIAAATLGPRVFREAPSATIYEQHVPLRGVIRPIDEPTGITVLVDDRWDAWSVEQRQAGLQALFAQAHELEDVSRIVVRDARGGVCAEVVDGEIVRGP